MQDTTDKILRALKGMGMMLWLSIIAVVVLIGGFVWWGWWINRDNHISVSTNRNIDITPQQIQSIQRIGQWEFLSVSDEEIAALAKTDAAQLSVEELLYAATLTKDAKEQMAIYQKAAELYNDYRAYNGMGELYFAEGNIAEARRCYAKALEIQPNDPDVNYNAGLAAMADNDLAKAEEYLGKAAGTKGDLKAAQGTFYTMKGDYKAAKEAYGNSATNNAAVQQILDEDYAGALQTLKAVKEPNATTAYLLAVVGARTNDRDAVYANLPVAIERDANMKAKAANDIEFAKFAEDAEFQAIVK